MAAPDPSQVAPWYLRNITQALALNESTGNVYVRTDAQLTIGNVGNVNVTDVEVLRLGNIDISGNTMPISGNVNIGTMPPITGNVTATISGTANVNVTGTYEMNVAQGLIAGTSSVFKSGYNPNIANNSEESLWGHSTLYPWSAWNTGGTLSCVSTSASDTGTMTITGLRSSDWVEITETVTMSGLTPVITSNSFIRINNLHYNGANTNVGEIDVSRGGTIVGCIEAGFGISQMAQYTVPAGYSAYILHGSANMGKGNDGTGKFKYRPFGGSFQTALTFLLYQSTFNYEFLVPLRLPEQTDLDVTMVASNSGTACSCAYGIILIQNPL